MNQELNPLEHKKFKIAHSAHDPFFKIQMEQHRYRTRTMWMIIGIIVITTISIISFIFISYATKYRATNQYNENKKNELNAMLQEIKTKPFFESQIIAFNGAKKALSIFYATTGIQAERTIWTDYAKQFQTYLNQNTKEPVFNESFVNPTFLGKMVAIPQGSFAMGARANEPDARPHEYPRHNVKITQPFWASECEITFYQWWQMGNYSYHVPSWKEKPLTAFNYPISGISWHNAMRFCALVNAQEKNASRLPKGYEYRLPTEAEWEYMARAGTENYYFWGDSFIEKGSQYANTWDTVAAFQLDNLIRTDYPKNDSAIVVNRVGAYLPNAFGLYDMIGNVSEWCYDWYNPVAYRQFLETNTENNPIQRKATIVNFAKRGIHHTQTLQEPTKIIRGGNWATLPDVSRCASRDFAPASFENSGIGFRLVLAPEIDLSYEKEVQEITVDSPITSENTAPSPSPKNHIK